MSEFAYTARDKSGGVIKGTLPAPNREAALSSLSGKGLTPILLKEGSGKKFSLKGDLKLDQIPGLGKLLKQNKVKLKEKVIFTRQFATMINAGVPVAQSLAILGKQSSSPVMKTTVEDLIKKVEGGSTLANALAQHPKVFPEVYVNMVRAGEAGGILDQVLDRLATQQEKDAEIVSKVRGAMIYPGVITTVTIGAFIFLMTVIVPKLSVIFEGLGAELPIYTRIMLAISKGLLSYGLFIVLAFGALGIFFFRLIKTPKGKRMFDVVLLRTPIFGQIIRKVNIARFARTFGSLMSSGLSVIDALTVTAGALGNTLYKEEVLNAASEVKRGKSVSETLRAGNNFPPIISQMVTVGEETGQIDKILLKIADFYEKEVDNVVSNITSIIEPILILVLGFMVGSIVISVFGPLSKLTQSIQ